MATHKLLLLPGDGIGPEVMAEVKRLIDWLNSKGIAKFETEQGLVGGSAYDAHKVSITEDTMAKAKAADAIIFGAVGGPKWDSVPYEARPEAGLLRLRKDLGLFANLRPAVCYPALADASSLKREAVEGLDIMIVRELTGGVYFGEPKTITDLGNGQKRAVDTQVYDTYEIERIGRVAFDLARKRRNKVTSMEKRNVMKSGVLWNEVMTQVHAREYKDVTLEHQLADSGGMNLVKSPKQFDVIVTDNLFGDMLSRHRGDADRLARHAAIGFARRGRRQDQKAPRAVRAGARLRARHRRQGPRQPDRDARLVRHGAALFLRHGRARRQARRRDRRRARERPAHRRHQVGGIEGGVNDADGRSDPGRRCRSCTRKLSACRSTNSSRDAKTRMAGTSPAIATSVRCRFAQYSGKRVGSPPRSEGGLSGWRSIGRLLFSRANDGNPYGEGKA